MKISSIQTPEKFKPVILNITLETPEELEVLYWMCSCNITVPETVYLYQPKERDTLCEVMTGIHQELQEYAR